MQATYGLSAALAQTCPDSSSVLPVVSHVTSRQKPARDVAAAGCAAIWNRWEHCYDDIVLLHGEATERAEESMQSLGKKAALR